MIGNLSCFQSFTITKSATVNDVLPTSFYIFASVFLIRFLEVGLLGQWINVYVIYLDIAQIFLLGDYTIFIPYNKGMFSIALP